MYGRCYFPKYYQDKVSYVNVVFEFGDLNVGIWFGNSSLFTKGGSNVADFGIFHQSFLYIDLSWTYESSALYETTHCIILGMKNQTLSLFVEECDTKYLSPSSSWNIVKLYIPPAIIPLL